MKKRERWKRWKRWKRCSKKGWQNQNEINTEQRQEIKIRIIIMKLMLSTTYSMPSFIIYSGDGSTWFL
jgi:hypothetical protein